MPSARKARTPRFKTLKPQVQQRVTEFLDWIEKNPHHVAAVTPPDRPTQLHLSGPFRSRSFACTTVRAAKGLYLLTTQRSRFYFPNKRGMKILAAHRKQA